MMSVKEYSIDVNKSIEEILNLCKTLNINANTRFQLFRLYYLVKTCQIFVLILKQIDKRRFFFF